MTTRAFGLAAVVTAAAITAACGGEATGDALFLGAGEMEICVPMPSEQGAGAIFGDGIIRNQSSGRLELVSVELVGGDGMALRDAYVTSIGSDGLVGIRHTTNLSEFPDAWQDRVLASGAPIGPGETLNLIAVVSLDQAVPTASGEGLLIAYKDDEGRQYHQQTPTKFYVSHDSCSDIIDG